MAAHLKTGIEQTLEYIANGKLNRDHIQGALELSCWTEDDYDTWQHLSDWVRGRYDLAQLEWWLQDDLKRANKEWVALGCPSTREGWHEAKYGPVEKGTG